MLSISKRTQAELSMLFVGFVWGTTFVVVKNALVNIGPFLFLGLRFIIAFLFLALLSFNSIKKVDRNTVLCGCLLGFFLFLGYSFQTVGLQYTTSSNAGFITGLSVILVPLIYSILHRALPPLSSILTALMATVGLYLMSVASYSIKLAYGDFLILLCAFGFAWHIVLVDLYSYRFNAIAITGMQVLFVGVLCIIIGLLVEPWPQKFTLDLWGAVIVTAFFATALAFLLQNALQKYSTPTRFAVILTSEPVFAAVAGNLWADEILSPRALVGASLILIAMLIAILTQKEKDKLRANP
ncbi:MAG: DMT family transporter [Syntrophomonadaceae bacterium]